MASCMTNVVGIWFHVMDMEFLGQTRHYKHSLCIAKERLALTKYSSSHTTTMRGAFHLLASQVIKDFST